MEVILDKLRLLKYEEGFCLARRPAWPFLTPTYFAFPPATAKTKAEQFQYFVGLAFWLLSLAGGKQVLAPAQLEDPIQTCTQLLQHCRGLGFAAPEFPVTKLRQGHGKAVCAVLRGLLDVAFERSKVLLEPALYPKDKPLSEEVQDFASLALKGEEEEGLSAGEEENYVSGKGSYDLDPRGAGAGPGQAAAPTTTRINPASWKIELERLAPQLKLTIPESKEWRSHLGSIHRHLAAIQDTLPECQGQLDHLQKDMSEAMNKISSRESFVKDHFDLFIHEYRTAREQLEEAQSRSSKGHGAISELTAVLSSISKELDNVRRAKDEHEGSISDTSPLVKIKKAIAQIQEEITGMRVRIRVVEHAATRAHQAV